MPDLSSPVTHWRAVADEADRGNLFLDELAARQCSLACDNYIRRLRDRQDQAKELAKLSGWGDFSAGRQLSDFYARRAVGGENSMVNVLQSHIDVVTEMKAVFDKFFTVTGDNEQQNASAIGSAGESPP